MRRAFPPEVEGAAYFTVCEGLANVLKHAHASHVEVRLDQRNGDLPIDVTDEGTGPGQSRRATGTSPARVTG